MISYGGGRMPSFAAFPAEYINAIVQYVTTGCDTVVFGAGYRALASLAASFTLQISE